MFRISLQKRRQTYTWYGPRTIPMRHGTYVIRSGCVQWEESFFPKTFVAIVVLFWLEWAGYLAVAGLNLLAQISDRISLGIVLNCVHCHMLSLLVLWHQVLHTTRTYLIRYLSQKIQACHSKVSCPFQPKNNNNGKAQSLEKDSPHCGERIKDLMCKTVTSYGGSNVIRKCQLRTGIGHMKWLKFSIICWMVLMK